MDVVPYAASLLPDEQNNVAALNDLPVYTLDVRVDWDALTVAGTERHRAARWFPAVHC